LINQVALFILGLCWQNSVNKVKRKAMFAVICFVFNFFFSKFLLQSRVANAGGCTSLVHQVIRLSGMAMNLSSVNLHPPSHPGQPEQSTSTHDSMNQALIWQKQQILNCLENLSLALASVLIYPSTHERMIGWFCYLFVIFSCFLMK
jgi:hypothetical protein